jgi:hypothetical protein
MPHAKLMVSMLTAAACLLSNATGRAGIYDELVRRLPEGPNILVTMDPRVIRASKFFQKEVTDAPASERDTRERMFPVPNVERAVLGAQFFDLESGRPVWQMAVMQTGSRIAMSDVAHYRGGKLEQVAGVDAVRLRDDSYLVALAPKLFAVASPANRQFISRTIKQDVGSRGLGLSKYLDESLKHISAGSYQLAMVIDLEDVVDEQRIRERLSGLGSLGDQKGKTDHVVSVLSGMRGAMLDVRFGVAAKATFTVDFSDDATTLQTIAKPLLQEVLDYNGARIDDVSAWTAEVRGKQVVYSGEMSLRGLRQALSLINTDAQVVEAPSPAEPGADAKQEAAQASLRHFRLVQSLLGELRNPRNTSSFGSGENGMWYEKYARKIDQLPVLNVDKDLLDYSAEVATRLRIQSAKYRGVGIKAAAETRNPNYWYYYYGNAYVYGRADSNYDVTRRVEQSAAAAEKVDQLKEIDESTARIRRTMTERYQVEF